MNWFIKFKKIEIKYINIPYNSALGWKDIPINDNITLQGVKSIEEYENIIL